MDKKPLVLKNNRVWRTYLGGAEIGRWQGTLEPDGHFPEEWVASTVEAVNPEKRPGEGLSLLADAAGETLRDRIARNPAALLGKDHAARFTDMDVLMKVLDSAERLAIQVHPNDATAQALFDSPYGKTESWHILGVREGQGSILLGFRPGVTREIWRDVFQRQDIPAMIDCLHSIPVSPGETYLIPGGVPHAIGGGCLILEVQQPTDLTIRTERKTPSGFPITDQACHQGLGFDRMFDCFHYDAFSYEDNLHRHRLTPRPAGGGRTELIRWEDTPYFALARLAVEGEEAVRTDDRFQVLVVWEGEGTLRWDGGEIPLAPATQVFLPAAAGEVVLVGRMTVLACHGPQP